MKSIKHVNLDTTMVPVGLVVTNCCGIGLMHANPCYWTYRVEHKTQKMISFSRIDLCSTWLCCIGFCFLQSEQKIIFNHNFCFFIFLGTFALTHLIAYGSAHEIFVVSLYLILPVDKIMPLSAIIFGRFFSSHTLNAIDASCGEYTLELAHDKTGL